MDSDDTRNIIDPRAVINELKKRLRVLQVSAAKFGEYVPAHITVEIGEIEQQLAAHERVIGEGKSLRRKEAQQAKVVKLIQERINAGRKKDILILIKRLGNIEGERYINVKKLISE